MKIWKATLMDPHNGTLYVWAASERAVRQLARNDWDVKSGFAVEQVEIPTQKAGLIEWLNSNFTTDNG